MACLTAELSSTHSTILYRHLCRNEWLGCNINDTFAYGSSQFFSCCLMELGVNCFELVPSELVVFLVSVDNNTGNLRVELIGVVTL